jgi:hypothetical protein
MKAVQALSGGAAGQLDPQRIQQMIAQTREIARTARMSMEVMSALINEGTQMAKSMGMSGAMGARLATQNVLLAQTAVSAVGGLPGQPTAFAGKVGFEGTYQVGQEMSMRGAASTSMSQLYSALHVAGELAGGAENLYTKDDKGNRIVNTDVVKDPLLQEVLGAALSNDPAAAEAASRKLRGLAGQQALVQSIVKQSGGKISEQAAYGMIFNKTFAEMGQTSFDLGGFTRNAQRAEISDLSANRLSMMGDTVQKLKNDGFDTSDEGLKALADAGIAPDEYTAQDQIARLLAQQQGKNFDKMSYDERVARRGAARSVAVTLRDNQTQVLRQQGFLPSQLNEVNANLAAQKLMPEIAKNLEAQGTTAEKLLGVGAADLMGRLSQLVPAIISGEDGAMMDGFMALAGTINNRVIRDKMQDSVLEARSLTRQIAEMKKNGADPEEIMKAEGQLERITNQLSSMPSEFGMTTAARMDKFQAASDDIGARLAKKDGYATDTERNAAIRQKAAFDGVLAKGSFDWNTDMEAWTAHGEYEADTYDRQTGQKITDHRKDIADRRKSAAENLVDATMQLAHNPLSSKAMEKVAFWQRTLDNIDKGQSATDTKNQKGPNATDKVGGGATGPKVEVTKLPPMDIAVKGTLTLDLSKEKALVDMKTFAEKKVK